jgi:hypothetical protein
MFRLACMALVRIAMQCSANYTGSLTWDEPTVDGSLPQHRFSKRDGRKGPPAGNKARCKRTYTAQSKATKHKAKPNQKSKTHTWGAKQALTTSVEGRARPRIGVPPAARVATYTPDRHRDALPRQRATLRCRSASEMKAARERPGLPACTAWSAESLSSVRAGAPRRLKDSTDIGTKGSAEDTC